MAELRPGQVHYVAAATKTVVHGAPAVEQGFAGVGYKQVAAPAGTGLGSTLVTTVQVGEAFIIQHKGQVYIANTRFGGGTFAAGDIVNIRVSDNALTTAAADASTIFKYGRVEAIAGSRGVGTGQMRVDLDARDSY